ncbi:MAG: 50S ribosomal protein L21 [Anaerolineales bacterium]
MKYAIVESGGKQYKAVEGETIEVDRLSVDAGDKVGLERVLMLVDGEDIAVGTPTVDGVQVSTTVTEHFKGPKIIVFKYSPKKRIRVKSGHRQQYTRLVVDTIGTGKKASKAKKTEEAPEEKKAEARAEKKETKASATKEKRAEKVPAKKTTTKKAATASSPKGKKSSSTEKSEK